jgi:hypothetical protein
MELLLATAEFFRVFEGARLALSATLHSMEMEHFSARAPKGHKREVLLD